MGDYYLQRTELKKALQLYKKGVMECRNRTKSWIFSSLINRYTNIYTKYYHTDLKEAMRSLEIE